MLRKMKNRRRAHPAAQANGTCTLEGFKRRSQCTFNAASKLGVNKI